MDLSYKRFGSGEPFIILHGLFGSSDNWHTHGKKLSEYFDVFLIDQRNHGNSYWSDEFNYDVMAKDLYEFLQKHELKGINLLGHSMGGKTAMRFAQIYPEYINKLIVADMGVKTYPITHDKLTEGLKSIDLANISSRSEAERQLSKFERSATVRQFLLKNLHRNNKQGFSWKINLEVLSAKLSEIAKALPNVETFTDTLFIHGGKSDYILEEDKEEIKKIFPVSQFHCIEQAGHWLHAEVPEKFLKEVLKFMLI